VTSGKIKNLGINSADLGTGSVINSKAVTNGKIANEAISSSKLSASLYSQLVRNVSYVTETSVNDSETEKSVTALCPAGKEAIGGGARINSPSSVAVANSGNYPLVSGGNSRIGWIATGRETATEPGNWQVVAYAVCAEL
jgi:hypothetical protein